MEKNMGGRSMELSRASTRDEDDDWEKIDNGFGARSQELDDGIFHGFD